MLFFGSRRFHGWYGFFGESGMDPRVNCRRGFEWSVLSSILFVPELIIAQDPIYLRAAVLDGRRWPVDPLANPTR
jgi:hypothetical protein